jgi:hypothetical protein
MLCEEQGNHFAHCPQAKKVKLSLQKAKEAIRLWDVEAAIFCLDNRLTDGGKFVSPTRRPPFTPR